MAKKQLAIERAYRMWKYFQITCRSETPFIEAVESMLNAGWEPVGGPYYVPCATTSRGAAPILVLGFKKQCEKDEKPPVISGIVHL